jgi:hypothetical protein
MTATTEFVVPRSIPTAFAITAHLYSFGELNPTLPSPLFDFFEKILEWSA